jgi:hypothetical protein
MCELCADAIGELRADAIGELLIKNECTNSSHIRTFVKIGNSPLIKVFFHFLKKALIILARMRLEVVG